MSIGHKLPLVAGSLSLLATLAAATPVQVTNDGYFLDTIGINTIGLAGGGSSAGTLTTLFIANTSPSGGSQGTTASATIAGQTTTVGFLPSQDLWARRVLSVDDFQRNALSVTFTNELDQTTVVTRNLFGVPAMPLAPSFTISGDPFRPLLSWTLPEIAGIDIDRVGIAFFDDDTNTEIGTRVFRSGSTTSYQLQSVLPEGLNIVFDLRFFDLDERILPGELGWGNGDILAMSRTYLAYSVPARVPEPGALGLVLLAGFAAAVARRRPAR